MIEHKQNHVSSAAASCKIRCDWRNETIDVFLLLISIILFLLFYIENQ